jgi:hypothetical protein
MFFSNVKIESCFKKNPEDALIFFRKHCMVPKYLELDL